MAEFDTQDDAGGGGGDAGDLSSALAQGDGGGFVTEAKKAAFGRGTIVMAGVALACAGAMGFMWMRSGRAAAAPTPDSAAANTTISQFLSADQDNVKQMRDLLGGTDKVVEQFASYPEKTQVPVKALRTNPFRLKAPDDPNAKEKVKVAVDEATARKQYEDRKVAAMAAVKKLRLQSILHGKVKSCMVNNALYTEGQKVEGFTIDKIEPRRVIVRSDVFRFELKMQK